MGVVPIFKSGFVSIIGRPNVGKSTLLNKILGEKVSIVSDRPQTTRNQIRGVKHLPGAQIVFLDTPGVHPPRHPFTEQMVNAALDSLKEVDLILFTVEVPGTFGEGDLYTLEQIRKMRANKEEGPVYLVINKIDRVPKPELLPVMEEGNRLFPFEEIIPVSAATGENIDLLVDQVVKALPEGPAYFPEDLVTDQPLRFIAAERVREKVFRWTYEEIPYSVGVGIEEFLEGEEGRGIVSIRAVIYVEKESQKGIVIGKGGSLLKKIGQEARKELEAILGSKVFLQLWVKVKKDWREDKEALGTLGYGVTR